jgi:hypothetical protein
MTARNQITIKMHLIGGTLIGALALTTACAANITPAEARAIAKEAYIYGFPVVAMTNYKP